MFFIVCPTEMVGHFCFLRNLKSCFYIVLLLLVQNSKQEPSFGWEKDFLRNLKLYIILVILWRKKETTMEHYIDTLKQLRDVLNEALEHGVSPDAAVKVCLSNAKEGEDKDLVGYVWSAVYDGKAIYLTSTLDIESRFCDTLDDVVDKWESRGI